MTSWQLALQQLVCRTSTASPVMAPLVRAMSLCKVPDDDFPGFAHDVLREHWERGNFIISVETTEKDAQGIDSSAPKRHEFRVFDAVLGKASPVFGAMIKQDNFVEGATSEVTITDFSAAAVEAFLRFLHFGEMDGSIATIMEVGRLADKYAVSRLHKLCSQVAGGMLWPHTACTLSIMQSAFGTWMCAKTLCRRYWSSLKNP